MTEADDVLTERHGATLVVTLNRPDRLNALTSEMINRLIGALRGAEQDDDVAVIVLTGAGRGFCAGVDTAGLAATTPEATAKYADDFPRDLPMRLSKPLLAAINGPAAGMGFSFALMADVRFAATTASVTTAFARYGLVAEQGSSYLLQEIVGRANALDLLLSSRKVDAETGYRIGLFQYLCEPEQLLAEVLGYAETLAANSAGSLAQIKQQLFGDPTRTWDQAWDDSTARMNASLGGADFRARVAAATGGSRG